MMSRPVQIVLSVVLSLHLAMVLLGLLAQREHSYLHDELLSRISSYLTLGNWKADAVALSFGTAADLGEEIVVEYHPLDRPVGEWLTISPASPRSAGQSRSSRDGMSDTGKRWLHQLSGLLLFENDEGIGELLKPILPRDEEGQVLADQVRITVSPNLSIDQYEELESTGKSRSTDERYAPQIAYAASVIDLGEGQLSLLRKLEGRRASKSIRQEGSPTAEGNSSP